METKVVAKSFQTDLVFNDKRVATSLILETSFSKEVRILLKAGQEMKEHTAPFPIVVQVLSGQLTFGVHGEDHLLEAGAILTLGPKVPHSLKAHEDAVVRLTLSKQDNVDRVKNID